MLLNWGNVQLTLGNKINSNLLGVSVSWTTQLHKIAHDQSSMNTNLLALIELLHQLLKVDF